MDNFHPESGDILVAWLILFVQRMDFLSLTENQAFKAVVSTFMILSQVSADLFIVPQASAAAFKQEYLHFHFEAGIALRVNGKCHRPKGSVGSTEEGD